MPLWCALALALVGYTLWARQLRTPSLASRPWLTYGATLTAGIWLLATYVPRYSLLLATQLDLRYDAVTLLGAILLTVSTLLVKLLLDLAFDYLLYRQHYDHPRAVLASATDLANADGRAGILQTLAAALMRTVAPVQFALLIPGEDGKFVVAEADGEARAMPAALCSDDPLVVCLRAGRAVQAEGGNVLASGEQVAIRQLREWQAAMALGMVAGDALHGIILLGEKRSSDAYTREELVLLQTMAHQAALALESAKNCVALQELNAHLEERVRERTAELAEANARLEEADRHKDQFLAFTSHELRTPLTAIIGWAELALLANDPARTKRALESILASGWRESRLIDDLLNISRLIHGKIALERVQSDLWHITEDSVQMVAHVAVERQLTISLQPPTGPLPVRADPNRMMQVIGNLLSNALKFSEAGGQITVTARCYGDMAEVAVHDTGRGIPAEQLERIFQAFAQVRTLESSGGLGIGLALAKGLVNLHGGTIHAESAGTDQGSTFIVRLPLAVSETPAVLVADGAGQGSDRGLAR